MSRAVLVERIVTCVNIVAAVVCSSYYSFQSKEMCIQDHTEFKKGLYPSGRLAHVFTKLHAVAMVKYDKVIVLDTASTEARRTLPSSSARPATLA